MKEAATMLQEEARRTASILHQTPGWRWRRELCLTERSQQCQSGPTTKAWRRLPARQRHDACETPSEPLGGAVPKNGEKRLPARQRWTLAKHRPGHAAGAAWKWEARAGCTARTRSTWEWTALFQRTWKTTPRDTCAALEARKLLRQSQSGWHRQTASSGRMRVAPPGSDTWTSAESTIEAGPSYRSCTASPQRRRGVTAPSLIKTRCELYMTCTYREA